MFNAEQFLHTETDSALDTKRIPIPLEQGDTFAGLVEKVDFHEAQGRKDPTKFYVFADITWALQVSDAVIKATGREKVTVRQSLIVDVNEAGTGIDWSKGKNIQLGRVREACGQNADGTPWAPNMLVGATASVKIKHRVDGEDTYDEVDAITAL